jgi:glycosyltransferase involved in cell wall biosynthesis
MTPVVSVNIPSYNGARYLEESAGSVLSQSFTNLECLIVDDGSTDNTRDVATRLANRDPRVRYFHKENGGAASARNFGVRQSRGDWVYMLDSDDWMHEDTLKIQLDRARDAGATGKTVVYSDFEVAWQDTDGQTYKTFVNELHQMTKAELIARIMSYESGPTMPLSPINTLLSRDIFDAISYDEEFGAWEEINFAIDILLMDDTKFLYAPAVAAVYRIHQSNSTADRERMFQNYIKFLTTQYKKDPALLQHCVTIGPMVEKAILDRDKNKFNTLVDLLASTGVPAYFTRRKIRIANPALLKLAYTARTVLPVKKIKRLLQSSTA